MQPSTQSLRTGVKRAAVVFLLFFEMVTISDAQQKNPAAEFLKQFNLPSGMGQVWEGTITFTQNDSKNKYIDDTQLGHQKEFVDKHTIQANATIRFCGSGSFYVSDVQRTWKEKWERGRIDAYYETKCRKEAADGKSETVPVSPGNENSSMEKGSGELCPQKGKRKDGSEITWFDETNYGMKPEGARVSMIPAPYHGGYWLDAVVEMFVNYALTATSLQTDVCRGKRKSSKRLMITVPFSQAPRSNASGGEDNKTYSFQAHPVSRKFVLHKHIKFSDGQEKIKGSCFLIEEKAEKPGDWNRLLVAKYELRMKNYCNDVFDALYADLAWAEAYNDPTVRQRAIDREYTISEYKAAVRNQAQQTYSANHPDPLSNTGVEMHADTRIGENGKIICYVKGAEEAKQSLRERCLPDIIFDAVYAHERRHVLQCKRDPDMFSSGEINKRGVYETDAHMAGIRKYISWLELNCPNDNRLAVAKDRLAALKANRTR